MEVGDVGSVDLKVCVEVVEILVEDGVDEGEGCLGKRGGFVLVESCWCCCVDFLDDLDLVELVVCKQEQRQEGWNFGEDSYLFMVIL